MGELKQIKLKDLTVDPEFENLIRKQTPEEAEIFERQMINHGGAHDPIMVWDNEGIYVILDGHHRYWFLLKHPEMAYRVEIAKEVHNRHEAEMWIFYQQKGKKNLTPFELSELALRFEPMLREEAKARMMAGKKIDPVQNSAQGSEKNKTRDEVARIAGVSHDTIDKTKKILAEGTEEQIEAVRSGEKSINKVFNEIRPPKPKAQPAQEPQENQEKGEVDTEVSGGRLSEDQKIQIAINHKRHPEDSCWTIGKKLGFKPETVKRWLDYPIPDGYEDTYDDQFSGIKNSKLPVERQKEILDYCKDHENQSTHLIASIFDVSDETVERIRNYIGQKNPSTRALNNRIDKMLAESAIYSEDDIRPNEYTEEDALDEMRVMRDEFLNKFERFLEIRRSIVGGKKETIQFIESFKKDVIDRLIDSAKKKGA